MRERLTGLGKILPLGRTGDAMPVIQGCPGLGISDLRCFKELLGDDSHRVRD
jgi:hypothetical protein